jgi:signal transduction histidine kinase
MERVRPLTLAAMVLALGLGITAFLTMGAVHSRQERAKARFGARVREQWSALKAEVGKHQRGLARVQDFFHQRETVTEEEWKLFLEVSGLRQEFPAFCEVGYAHQWDRAPVALAAPEIMKRTAAPGGASGDVHFPVLFHYAKTTCFHRDRGADLTPLEPRFLDRILEAKASASTRISPPVRLPNSEDGTPRNGLIIYLPVYRAPTTNVSALARAAGLTGDREGQTVPAFRGVVFGVLEIDGLIDNFLGREPRDVAFEVFDGPEALPSRRVNTFPPSWWPGAKSGKFPFSTNLVEDNVSGSLLIRYHATPWFDDPWTDGRVWATALVGGGLSLLLSGLVFSQARGRETAESLAEELVTSRQLLREAQLHREQLCRDLHDRTIQSLYGVGLSLGRLRRQLPAQPQAADQIGEQLTKLQLAVSELRGFLTQLDSNSSPAARPEEAFTRLLTDCQHSLSIEIDREIDPEVIASFSARQMAELMSISREALTNAVRHGRARHASVRLVGQPEKWRLEITDDGTGFDPATSPTGQGLKNLRERAELLGGSFHVASKPGGPTVICVAVATTALPVDSP